MSRSEPSGSVAYERLINEHSGMLWRIAGSYEADQELRRELHQEILIAIWRALPRFQGNSNVRTYLARIAHNRGISHVASQMRRPSVQPFAAEPVSSTPSPAAHTEQQLGWQRLMISLRQLPLPMRQVIGLTLEGFVPREIAEVLGLSANVVSIRLTRAKKILKHALEES